MKGQRSLLREARMKVKAMSIEEVAYTGRKSRGGAQRLGNLLQWDSQVDFGKSLD